MSTLQQLGPSVFNIGSEIQQKMVKKLLEDRFGYSEKDVIALWKKTQEEFIGGKIDPPHRDSAIYKYTKMFKKKKGDAKDFYSKKLMKEYEDSGMPETKTLLLDDKRNKKLQEDYGKLQTIINVFLYKKKNNPYYEWALDIKKFEEFGQEMGAMYTEVPKNDDKIKEDIAKNNKKFEIEARAGLIEASLNITRQCLDSCGRKPNNNAYCYICGEIIDSESGEDASGSQCEHVVPVTSLAALCGLSGPDYEKTIDAYFEKNKGSDGTVDGNGMKITREAYKLWRDILIGDGTGDVGEAYDHGGGKKETGVMYRWAHPACNMIKKDHAFLGLDWNAARNDADWVEMTERGFPILDEEDYCDEAGIKYVLNCLANEPINGKKGGGGSNSSKWRDRFKDDIDARPRDTPLGPAWVQKRYNAMHDNTMKWAMCGVLSKGIDGVFKAQYEKAPSEGGGFVTEDEWPRFRTALCDLSMKILDFRVEEKIQVHYSKFVGENIKQTMLKDIIEEWRKSEWIDLVGESIDSKQKGGNPTSNRLKQRNTLSSEERRGVRKTNASEKRKGSRDSKLLELRSRGPGYPILKVLNDNALLLPIYFDVFDAVTEDEEERICRAETMAENYRENFNDYVDTDALNHEMMAALENIKQGVYDVDTGMDVEDETDADEETDAEMSADNETGAEMGVSPSPSRASSKRTKKKKKPEGRRKKRSGKNKKKNYKTPRGGKRRRTKKTKRRSRFSLLGKIF